MKIVFDYPPLMDEIDARFHVRNKRVIYAWGGLIYNPMRIQIPPQLVAHERVHGQRQGDDIQGWWYQYIEDDAFRIEEEIQAHRAEYKALVALANNRHARRSALHKTARRLVSPLYGSNMSEGHARKLLVA